MGPGNGDPPRLRVLAFSRCYPPGFRGGGPVRSLVNLVQALGTQVDFRIITLDRDLASDPPYPSVRHGSWQVLHGAEVLYLSRRAATVRRLSREVARISPQVIYLNSFFDPIFTLKVLAARKLGLVPTVPTLLAPQGELSTGALGLKAAKKSAFLQLARVSGLYRDITWQASNELEKEEIVQIVKTVRRDEVRVASDLTEEVSPEVRAPIERRVPGPLRLCFLSRISPKKNLDFALRVLVGVKVPVEFAIFGPIEDVAYWAECERLLVRLPSNIRAVYKGEVPPDQVKRTLARHDLFFFPTRGENFGHVIFESLAAGVPVLISDQTPWSDVETHEVGWSLPLSSMSAFGMAIEALSARLPADHDVYAERSMAYASARVDRAGAIARAYSLFRDLVPQ